MNVCLRQVYKSVSYFERGNIKIGAFTYYIRFKWVKSLQILYKYLVALPLNGIDLK